MVSSDGHARATDRSDYEYRVCGIATDGAFRTEWSDWSTAFAEMDATREGGERLAVTFERREAGDTSTLQRCANPEHLDPDWNDVTVEDEHFADETAALRSEPEEVTLDAFESDTEQDTILVDSDE